MPLRITIAVTMGDPGGIGPEVTVKALADAATRGEARYRVYGLEGPMREAAERAGIAPFWSVTRAGEQAPDGDVVLIDYGQYAADLRAADPNDEPARTGRYPGAACGTSGALSLRFCEDAIRSAKRRDERERSHAVVTAPICKQAWALAGELKFPGHTELFGARFGATKTAMMFVSPRLRVLLATAHIPLRDVPHALREDTLVEKIELGHEACVRLGIPKPRVAVCGLNPHAGENGLLGRDEERTIEPALETLRAKGIDARGPFPADTIFHAALRGDFDLVVAMYHDQGLIPLKLLAWDCAVNTTLGLPVPRTSPDHGTAFDISGQNKADPGSMKAAVVLAREMAARTEA